MRQAKFEDNKEVIRRTDNTMTEKKRTKGQTTTNKTLHRKLKIEQYEAEGALEG
jgi:hypothetical protein